MRVAWICAAWSRTGSRPELERAYAIALANCEADPGGILDGRWAAGHVFVPNFFRQAMEVQILADSCSLTRTSTGGWVPMSTDCQFCFP